MENTKFLCQLTWQTYKSDGFEDVISTKVSEIKTMSIAEMNDFVKKHSKPKIKVLSTFNEQNNNKSLKYKNLKEWFEMHSKNVGTIIHSSNNQVRIQFYGFAVYFNPDGTYILTDTSGG